MKQFTTPEQTAKLIELGLERPKAIIYASAYQEEEGADPDVEYEYAYSIGELLSFLPDDGVADRRLEFDGFHWFVDWDSFDEIRQTMGRELIDALYDMIIKLKESKAL